MKPLTQEQFEKIKDVLPKPRGTVKTDCYNFLNALLDIAQNGYKWRRLPAVYGRWHTVYMRFRRWEKSGVFPRLLLALQTELGITVDFTALSLDSTCVKVHPDAAGALKKTDRKPSVKATVDGTRKSTRSSPTKRCR
ncbi:transposase [Planctomycetales bacterium]|nr:transposase [Planctomycetales bacterium]